MELDSHPSGPNDQLRLITSHYNRKRNDPLFIIVHNLDGTMLRNEKAQNILSKLASLESVHMIASLDHINTPLCKLAFTLVFEVPFHSFPMCENLRFDSTE